MIWYNILFLLLNLIIKMSYNVNDIKYYNIIGQRVAAYFLDFLILSPIMVISLIIAVYINSLIAINVWSFFSFILIFTFFTFFTFLYGQTPGKMFMNIIILDENGNLPSLQKSILRSSSYFITSIPLLKLADIISIILNSKRRSIRDFAAGTIVVSCDNKINSKYRRIILLLIIFILIINVILLNATNLII